MNNLLFLFEALKNGLYKNREWVISIFALTQLKEITSLTRTYEYQICLNNGRVGFIKNNSFIEFETQPLLNTPLFLFTDRINITKNIVENVPEGETLTTTIGLLLINYICLIYPFGDKVPYINKNGLESGDIAKVVTPLLQDEVDITLDKTIPISEFIKHQEALYYYAGFANLCVPVMSERTLTVNPEIIKLRDSILKANPDKLNDITWIAAFEKQLIQLDKEWIETDPNGGFIKGSKAFDVVRKKLFLQLGAEFDIVDPTKFKLISKSLDEGISIEDLPTLASGLRLGSFSRGAMTALGGEKVKKAFRFLSNIRLVDEDCGSRIGIPVKISNENYASYENCVMIENGENVVITKKLLSGYIGKTVIIRHPQTCQTPGIDFCPYCVGLQFRGLKTSLGVAVSDIGSVMMLKQMKKMHGTSLTTVKMNIEEHIF